MKNLNSLFGLLMATFCVVIVIQGCKDEDDNSISSNCVDAKYESPNLLMKIDGVNWNPDCGSWDIQTIAGLTTVTILVYKSDGSQLVLSPSDYSGLGTYVLDGHFTTRSIAYYKEPSGTFYGDFGGTSSGSIIITSQNGDNISGTFNFIANDGAGDTITISNGVFVDVVRSL